MSRLLPAPWFAAALALLASGCASSLPAAPALHVTRSHRAGRALGDAPTAATASAPAAAPPTTAPASGLDSDPAAALALYIEWDWLPTEAEAQAIDGLQPIGVHALAVVGSGGDDPFTAAPRIIGSVRVALGDGARDIAERLRATTADRASSPSSPAPIDSTYLSIQQDALPVGVTTSLIPGPLALELSRPTATSGVELALVRDGTVPLGQVRRADAVEEESPDVEDDETASAGDAERRAQAATPVSWREVVLLDTNLQPGGPPAVIALPGSARGGQLLAVIEVREAPTEGEAATRHAALLEQCLADVADSAAIEAEKAAAVDAVESKHRQLLAAAREMAAEGDRRRAGVFLAAESGATLALDTVLAADAAALDELAAAWRKAAGNNDEQLVQGDHIAWGLERTTALWLAQRAESGTLPAELEAVLLRHTGVVGRSPGLLEQFAEECDGLQSWRERLEQENRLALEDSLPGARVRAFDWLAARALAPAGYDPLAPRAERQAALLAADEAP